MTLLAISRPIMMADCLGESLTFIARFGSLPSPSIVVSCKGGGGGCAALLSPRQVGTFVKDSTWIILYY